MREITEIEKVEIKEQFHLYMGMVSLAKNVSEMDSVEIPGKEMFADGIYGKTITVPAGTFAIGKRNRFSAIHFISKGRILMFNGINQPLKEIVAPCIYVSSAGDKKMGFFVEETEWTAVFLNPGGLRTEEELDEFLHVPEKEVLTQLAFTGEEGV